MDNMPLVELLDADREMILAGLSQDRSPQAAQQVLEKALDRVALRRSEQGGDAAVQDAAQTILRTVKSDLPLVDSVNETRRWQQSALPEKRRVKPASLALLAVGVVLILAVMLGLMLVGGRLTGVLTLLEALLPAAAGMAAIYWAGLMNARPAKAAEDPAVRDEFLIDPEKLWHHLRGMMLAADSALENLSARESAKQEAELVELPAGAISRQEAELFSALLENAYAQPGEDSREMIENMRFYLHGRQVDVVEYAAGRESWFEFLPAQRPGTIRPALVSNDKLIKKGLAAA